MNPESSLSGLRPFLPGLQMIAYDFDTNSGVLWCSRICSSTDLAFIVALFRRLDDIVHGIQVYCGDDLVATYERGSNGWTERPSVAAEEEN